MDILSEMRKEMKRELATTRTVLERVPLQDPNWTPHPKSMSIGRLAQHLAEIPNYCKTAVTTDSLDVMTLPPKPVPASTEELLTQFDKDARTALQVLEEVTLEQLQKPWSLMMGSHALFTMPKLDVLRTVVLNHSIHHRGQLSVYLRLKDVPIPSIYGPTADTQ